MLRQNLGFSNGAGSRHPNLSVGPQRPGLQGQWSKSHRREPWFCSCIHPRFRALTLEHPIPRLPPCLRLADEFDGLSSCSWEIECRCV